MPSVPDTSDEVLARCREAMTGPVASVHTPFDRDGSVDVGGLRSLVDFVIAGGAGTVLLTWGDSLFSLLTDDEVAEVTRAVVEQTAGRALTIAACNTWATPKALQFADWCVEIGADLLMLKPPNWAGSATPETLVEHYRVVSGRIPVMVVTNVFAGWPHARAMQVLETLADTAPGVVAVKDDLCNDFARRLGLVCHQRMAIISGGQKQNHLNAHPYGCDGYMSSYILFRPEMPRRYWRAIEEEDLGQAVAIIRDYDMPLFDFVMALPGGFDAGMHGTLELFGIAGRWRRKPYHSLTDEEMDRLADFHRGLGLL